MILYLPAKIIKDRQEQKVKQFVEMERNQHTSKTINTNSEKYLVQKFNRDYNVIIKEILEEGCKVVNYLRYKEFLVKVGFANDHTDSADNQERALLFDLWRMLKGEVNDEMHVEDLRIVVLTILRMTDHKRIGVTPPLDEEESTDVGFFNEDGRYCLRLEDIPYVQKHYELFYLNRLQFFGRVTNMKKAKAT